jgi:hypothetical protein
LDEFDLPIEVRKFLKYKIQMQCVIIRNKLSKSGVPRGSVPLKTPRPHADLDAKSAMTTGMTMLNFPL